ncbi:hypothetical protein GGI05_000760, partial [Coemansia sp. RSA 2603]
IGRPKGSAAQKDRPPKRIGRPKGSAGQSGGQFPARGGYRPANRDGYGHFNQWSGRGGRRGYPNSNNHGNYQQQSWQSNDNSQYGAANSTSNPNASANNSA